MEPMTNAQIALQAATQSYSGIAGVSGYQIESRADSFLRWLNDNTPEERVQDER